MKLLCNIFGHLRYELGGPLSAARACHICKEVWVREPSLHAWVTLSRATQIFLHRQKLEMELREKMRRLIWDDLKGLIDRNELRLPDQSLDHGAFWKPFQC